MTVANALVLHEGHAPISVQQAFHDALDMIEDLSVGVYGQFVPVEGKPVALADVVSAMARCSDLVPRRTLDLLFSLARRMEVKPDSTMKTYGDWFNLVELYCRERTINELPRACA